MRVILWIFVIAIVAGLVWDDDTSSQPEPFDWNDALTLCREHIRASAFDPETASIPYVKNFGSGDEYYYAWGRSTHFIRMNNRLGNDVPVTASCIVNGKTEQIDSLTIDGQDVIAPTTRTKKE